MMNFSLGHTQLFSSAHHLPFQCTKKGSEVLIILCKHLSASLEEPGNTSWQIAAPWSDFCHQNGGTREHESPSQAILLCSCTKVSPIAFGGLWCANFGLFPTLNPSITAIFNHGASPWLQMQSGALWQALPSLAHSEFSPPTNPSQLERLSALTNTILREKVFGCPHPQSWGEFFLQNSMQFWWAGLRS